jgi:hypothetical protein
MFSPLYANNSTGSGLKQRAYERLELERADRRQQLKEMVEKEKSDQTISVNPIEGQGSHNEHRKWWDDDLLV